MRRFSLFYPDSEFGQTPSAQISWSHNGIEEEKFKQLRL